jgi:hypothetical protein
VLLTSFLKSAECQQFTLYSSRWSDVNSKSNSKTSSVIYIDSTKITIEQGESHLYLDVTARKREENNFFYTVINFNDETCTALFSVK